jgi:hypothetical protein
MQAPLLLLLLQQLLVIAVVAVVMVAQLFVPRLLLVTMAPLPLFLRAQLFCVATRPERAAPR